MVKITRKDGTSRPISLSLIVGKVLDKIINKRLQTFLERSGNISEYHHAYRQDRGIVDTLKNFV